MSTIYSYFRLEMKDSLYPELLNQTRTLLLLTWVQTVEWIVAWWEDLCYDAADTFEVSLQSRQTLLRALYTFGAVVIT